jgi:acetyl esterase/lipase
MHGQNRRHRILLGRWIRAITRGRSWIRSGQCELWRATAAGCRDISVAGLPNRVGSYGGKDPRNRSVAQKLEETFAGTGIAHDVKEYPEAEHSFLNNHETSFFKMLQIIHIAYDEPAAKDARRRIVSFFESIWAVREHHTPVAHP